MSQLSTIKFPFNFTLRLVLAQVEIAEREQELIKGIELIRQKMLKSTYEASQKIIELNTELAELEVAKIFVLSKSQFSTQFNFFLFAAQLQQRQSGDAQVGENPVKGEGLYSRQREGDDNVNRLDPAFVSGVGETQRRKGHAGQVRRFRSAGLHPWWDRNSRGYHQTGESQDSKGGNEHVGRGKSTTQPQQW